MHFKSCIIIIIIIIIIIVVIIIMYVKHMSRNFQLTQT